MRANHRRTSSAIAARRSSTRTITGLIAAAGVAASASVAAGFTPGNILVTSDGEVREYTSTGLLVSTLDVPAPTGHNYRTWDVAMDPESGWLHVLAISGTGPDFISSYDPSDGTWMHTPHTFLPHENLANGDLTFRDGKLYTRSQVFEFSPWGLTELAPAVTPSADIAEVYAGPDGAIYTLGDGALSSSLEVTLDGDTAASKQLELRDAAGQLVDGRGVAVDPLTSNIFVAGWDGNIFKYDSEGGLLATLDTRAEKLLEIDIDREGRISAGSERGEVIITDVEFSTTRVWNWTSGGPTYTTFVVPTPGAGALLGIAGLILARRGR
jgi:WD40 repeat protein